MQDKLVDFDMMKFLRRIIGQEHQQVKYLSIYHMRVYFSISSFLRKGSVEGQIKDSCKRVLNFDHNPHSIFDSDETGLQQKQT